MTNKNKKKNTNTKTKTMTITFRKHLATFEKFDQSDEGTRLDKQKNEDNDTDNDIDNLRDL